MTNFYDFLEDQLKDESLKQEYDALDSEFAQIQAVIDMRKTAAVHNSKTSVYKVVTQ